MEDDLERRVLERLGVTLRDKYRLERLLGVGGMAAVYAAEHRNGRRVAVKMLHTELSVNREIRERFLREGQAANRVGHPGAVAVLDDDVSEDGAAFLVMELLDGDSLENLSQKGALAEPVLAAVGLELLAVLAAAHRNGIVHRDIKPANLFITSDGQLKVLDFGIARVTSGSASATQTGTTLGTPAFMAPEQALGRTQQIDARTDVWAVGATLFSLASGQSVHSAETAQETLIRAATQPAPSLASVRPSASRGLVDVVDRALAFDAASRWQSAEAMRDALAAAAGPSSRAELVALVEGKESAFIATSAAAPRTAAAPHSTDWGAVTGAAPRSRASIPKPLFRALGAVAALTLLGSLSAAWHFRRPSSTPTQPSESSVTATTPATTDGTLPVNPATISAVPAAPAAAASTPATSSARTEQPRSRPESARPARAVAASAPKAEASRTTPAAPVKPSVNCNPPYLLDSAGNKRWKRECL